MHVHVATAEQTQNAAETVKVLTQHAAALADQIQGHIAALQQSSSKNVDSTQQHLALYDEAVQTLQVVAERAALMWMKR